MNTRKTILLLLILLMIGGGGAYYYFSTTEGTDTPPEFEVTGIYQGKLEDTDKYHYFNKKDAENFKKPKDEKSRTLSKEPKVNYIYYKEDKNMKTILEDIEPKEDLGVYFITYNPEKDYCLEGAAGYHTYKGLQGNSTKIENLSKAKLKAYCPIMISVTESTNIWGAKNQTDDLTSTEFSKIISEMSSIDGWVLTPVMKNKSFAKTIKPNSKNRIRIVFPLTKEKFYDANDGKDLDAIKIEDKSYLAWLKFGDTYDCGAKKYLSGDTCRSCTKSINKDRECNTEKTTNNEIAKWKFDERSGKTLRDSVSYNDGTINNAKFVEGIKKYALKFTGEESNVEIPYSNEFTFGKELTISAWVNKDKKTIVGDIIKIGKHELILDQYKGWRAKFRVNDKNYNVDWKENRKPKSETWYHLVATYDGNKIKLYVDGVLKNSLEKQGTLNNTEDPVFIGGEEGTYFKGMIDEVTVFKKALTKAEVEKLYDSYIE